MEKRMTIQELKKTIAPIVLAEGIVRSALFGSVVRGEADDESDIDVLVEMPSGKSLFDLVGLKLKLEDAVGRPVDLVTYGSLHPLLRENIERELVPLT
ncbi:MAG: nucleotidyltransferase family protein [Candidatus Jorgensenbacteria bacterium]